MISSKLKQLSRRSVLRGMVGGTAVTVALPLLECFLNPNATALADGSPLPVRFGTWFWGLGMDAAVFEPKIVGADYDLPPQISSWKNVKQHINLFTNYRVVTDGRPNLCHYTGWVALRCGSAPGNRSEVGGPSLDVVIGDAVGGGVQYRSLSCAASGSARDSYSFRSADAVTLPEVSAVAFYRKVFGPDFQGPNSDSFTPSTKVMLRKSALSGVMERTAQLQKQVGAADRARLDQHFTAIRQLEERLELQLQKPPAAPSCRVPAAVAAEAGGGNEVELVGERHKAMADLMAMAIACNQTRIFNMTYSNSTTGCVKQGLDKAHHTLTHEEYLDEKLGYQPMSYWFVTRAMESFAYFVQALADIPEGDGTLLDNTLIYAHSDQELAKVHSINGIPMMTAGRAGGRIKSGMHLSGKGEVATRLGYTMMKVMGLPVGEWGTGTMQTSKEISEILV